MNRNEHLLACLSEECGEIQQAVGKALRFGLDDGHPEKFTTNAQDIAKECQEVIAIIEMLESNGIIERTKTRKAIDEKKVKVLRYMAYAESRGTLTS